jgi:hypothetical protein
MRVLSSFIFLVAAFSCSRVTVASASNIFEAEAAGREIDYLDATSDFAPEFDAAGGMIDYLEATGGGIDYLEATSDFAEVDAFGSGIDDIEATTYPLEAEADGSAFGDADTSVEAGAVGELSNNIFADSLEAVAAGKGINMLDNQIICGYQGWFGFPGDGAPINRWRHWFRGNVSDPSPKHENVNVDFYPTIDEYGVDDLKASGIKLPDGSEAKFFSSARPNVVKKHFEWMAAYGISGVFHHRFMLDWNSTLHTTRTVVLRNVRSAAEATGRFFAVSYDIAGNGNAVIGRLKTDWMTLVDKEGITNSSQYIRQNGLPVLHIFGIGLASIAIDDTPGMQDLINWLKSEAAGKYRVFVLGGVPGKWRDGTGDSRPGTAWKNIYDSLDGIQPWHVGRWKDSAEFDAYYLNFIAKDAAYCKEKGILYMPTMWPGFSWQNLKSQILPRPAINSIPRSGGNFMWNQAHKYVANNNITSIWCAQFDEVDEGTAIFKVTAMASDLPLPVGGWLALDADGSSYPSDWYLRLTGEAQLMLEGKRPLTSALPLTRMPTGKPTTRKPRTEPSSSSMPTSKPTTGKPTTRMPTTPKPTTEPSSSMPTSKPSSRTPTTMPTSKPTTGKPTTRMPTQKPRKNRKPTMKPSKPTTNRRKLLLYDLVSLTLIDSKKNLRA